jgi:hypothetical protein
LLLPHPLSPSSSHLLLCHPISSFVAVPLVCSHCPHLSSCLPLPLISHSHHHLSIIALRHLSAGQQNQTIVYGLLPTLSMHHLLSATVVFSCLPPLHSLMADCQFIVCRPPPLNHPLLSATKAVLPLPLVSSHHLLAGSARRAVI